MDTNILQNAQTELRQLQDTIRRMQAVVEVRESTIKNSPEEVAVQLAEAKEALKALEEEYAKVSTELQNLLDQDAP